MAPLLGGASQYSLLYGASPPYLCRDNGIGCTQGRKLSFPPKTFTLNVLKMVICYRAMGQAWEKCWIISNRVLFALQFTQILFTPLLVYRKTVEFVGTERTRLRARGSGERERERKESEPYTRENPRFKRFVPRAFALSVIRISQKPNVCSSPALQRVKLLLRSLLYCC